MSRSMFSGKCRGFFRLCLITCLGHGGGCRQNMSRGMTTARVCLGHGRRRVHQCMLGVLSGNVRGTPTCAGTRTLQELEARV